MRPGLLPLLLVILVGAAGCDRRTSATFNTIAPVPARTSEGTPTKDEVLDYLDGKEILLAGGHPPLDGPKYTIRKADIEALKVGSGASVNNGPWSTEIDLLLNTGQGRFAILARVEHKLIENKRAFFGYKIERVARQ
jgi:hypothetical protein